MLLLVLALVSQSAQGGEFKISTWNIEWLHSENKRGNAQRDDEDYDRLAVYAARLHADVIALQEIDGPEAAKRVFPESEYEFYFSDRKHTQLVGFAVRKRPDIAVLKKVELTKLSEGDRLRRGVELTVKLGATPIRFLTVHLKARCDDGKLSTAKKGTDCYRLNSQLTILEDWVDATATLETPYVLLGDLNRYIPSTGDEFWPDLNDGQPENVRLARISDGDKSYCWSTNGKSYRDHIVVDPLANMLVVQDTAEEMKYDQDHANFKRVLSNHCPLSVIFKTP